MQLIHSPTQWYQSAQFLRNVPILRYLHFSTTTHKFVVFYSLDWMNCSYIVASFHEASGGISTRGAFIEEIAAKVWINPP